MINKNAKLLVLALTALSMLVGCKPGEDKAIDLAQKEIAMDMKDPDSAKFRFVRVANTEEINDDSVGALVCGQVNAKNAFGAYGGNQKFMVALIMTSKGFFTKAVTYKVVSKHIFDDSEQADNFGYSKECGEDK